MGKCENKEGGEHRVKNNMHESKLKNERIETKNLFGSQYFSGEWLLQGLMEDTRI